MFLAESKISLKRKTDFYSSGLVQAYASVDSGKRSTEVESSTEKETDDSVMRILLSGHHRWMMMAANGFQTRMFQLKRVSVGQNALPIRFSDRQIFVQYSTCLMIQAQKGKHCDQKTQVKRKSIRGY